MTFARKIIAIVCSCLFILAGILVLIFYFAFRPTGDDRTCPVIINDMQVSVGQTCDIDFTLKEDNVTFTFSITDTSIAKIVDETKVYAIKQGVTFLKVEASNGNDTFTSIAQLAVTKAGEGDQPTTPVDPPIDQPDPPIDQPDPPIDQPDPPDEPPTEIKYSFKLVNLENCEFDGSTLKVAKNAFFTLEIYYGDKLIIPGDCLITASAGIVVSKDLGLYFVSASTSGEISFRFIDIDYEFTIAVEPM